MGHIFSTGLLTSSASFPSWVLQLVSLFLVMPCSYSLPSPLLRCSFSNASLIGSLLCVNFFPLLTDSIVTFSVRRTWSSSWSQPICSSSRVAGQFHKFTLWKSLTKPYSLPSCNNMILCLFSWFILQLKMTVISSVNGPHEAVRSSIFLLHIMLQIFLHHSNYCIVL